MIAQGAAQCVYPVIWPGEFDRIQVDSSISLFFDIYTDKSFRSFLTERMRAAKGTTAAALAIGTTNVSSRSH